MEKIIFYWNIIKQNYYFIMIIYFIIGLLFILFSNKKISEWIKEKKQKIIIVFIFILPIIVLIGLFIFVSKKDFDGGKPIIDIDWNQIASGEDISTTGFQFLEGCNYKEYLDKYKDTEYKVLSIFGEPKRSPTDFSNHRLYTNVFDISGEIDEAYLCISSNVVPYRQNNRFYYTTYILFNEPAYAGHIRVGYNKSKKILYDKSTSSDQKLFGRFRGSEVPKIYQENLKEIIVADWKNGGTGSIYPLERLKQEGRIVIGGFVNATNQEGILEEFLIIYKGGLIEKK